LKNVNESSKLKDLKENPGKVAQEEKLKIKDTLNTMESNKNENLKKTESTDSATTTTETKNETSETTKPTEATVEDRIEKKKNLYKSLWEKEYEYADVLVRMLQSFRKPLIEEAKSENPSISMKQIETLFDGFDEILHLSWTLCGELKIIYNVYNQLKPVNIGRKNDIFMFIFIFVFLK